MNDFRFSNTHADLMARDARHVMGWRYDPPVVFRGGKGTKILRRGRERGPTTSRPE